MRAKSLVAIIITLVILNLSSSSIIVLAAPVAQAPCSNNVLANPGFEEGFSDRGASELTIANGWNLWWQNGPRQDKGFFMRPEYEKEDKSKHGSRRIHGGNYAQKVFGTYATHNAGLYQQVQVTVGSKLTFSCWVQAWSSDKADPSAAVEPGNYHVYVGIDPTGGTDGLSPNVVWSPGRMEYNTWLQLSVEATAQAGTVTVFLRGEPEFRVHFNDSYWDDACLNVVKPTPKATNTPRPTSTRTITPTPTHTATPTNTPLPPKGQVCAAVYQDLNQDGQKGQDEGVVTGVVLTLFDAGQREVGKQTTDASTELLCFDDLEPGTYYLREAVPSGWAAADGIANWAVVVSGGQTASLSLSLLALPTPTATARATATPMPTPTPLPRPGIGATIAQTSGIWVALLAILIGGGVFYLRKRP